MATAITMDPNGLSIQQYQQVAYSTPPPNQIILNTMNKLQKCQANYGSNPVEIQKKLDTMAVMFLDLLDKKFCNPDDAQQYLEDLINLPQNVKSNFGSIASSSLKSVATTENPMFTTPIIIIIALLVINLVMSILKYASPI